MNKIIITLIVLATITSASVVYYLKQQSPVVQEVATEAINNYAANNVKYAKTTQLPEPLGTLIPIFTPSDIWPAAAIIDQTNKTLNTRAVSATFYTQSPEADLETIAAIVNFYQNLFDQKLSKQGWKIPQRGSSVNKYVPYKAGDKLADLEFIKDKETISILVKVLETPTVANFKSMTIFTITYSGPAK